PDRLRGRGRDPRPQARVQHSRRNGAGVEAMTVDLDHDLLIETFAVESQENLVAIEQALIRLEKNPDDGEALGAVFRGAHTIKGNAATLGFRALAAFAHAFEDVLDRLRRRHLRLSTALTSVMLSAVDVIRQSLPIAIAGGEELVEEADAVREALARYAGDSTDPDPSAGPAGGGSGSGNGPASGADGGASSRSLRVDVDKLD